MGVRGRSREHQFVSGKVKIKRVERQMERCQPIKVYVKSVWDQSSVILSKCITFSKA